ncbi:MAG: hypothetical protein RLZZ312_379 [Bacteroidota bacterium]|jgi:hypothetical protein
MPEISRFYGIIIYMYINDHNPPHFHARYNENEATFSITDFALIKGKLPPKALGLVVEWASLHNIELLENWKNLVENDSKSFNKIEPLN